VKNGRWLGSVIVVVVLGVPGWAEESAPAPPGKALYESKCALCHGANGVAKATAKGSANLNDPAWQKKTTDEAIVEVTLKGKNKMPKYEGKLTNEEVQSIVSYIRSLP
jgi:mono/diheme cytochrome c family protein